MSTSKLDEAERDVVTALLQVAHAASALLDGSRLITGFDRVVEVHDVEPLRAALDVWHEAEDVRAAEMVRALRGDDAPAGVDVVSCPQSPTGGHEVDPTSAVQASGPDLVVDYWCRHCGACGSVTIEPKEILWWGDENDAPAGVTS